jgi:pimeloyl-ACP methyl ester carboxylesterase
MARIAKAGHIMLIVVSIPLGAILILLAVLLALSPGRPRPLLDENGKALAGSISEKTHVLINGVQQGMFIEGRDIGNPVLLFLHGGTAMPEYFLTQKYPTDLEQYFTVCWWDRRGAGLSYSADIPPETMTLEQSISDTIEVTNYLRNRFHKDKIFLMAHSGGSLIGIQAAARAPELYSAYIGVAQMSYQLKSETLFYEYSLQTYREIGNKQMVRQLEAEPATMSIPLPASYMKVRDKAMHELGVGTTREMRSHITGVFFASWLCREYTLGEKLAIWRGKFSSDKTLWDKIIAVDLTRTVQKVDLPVYFLHGKYDYTVSYPLARAYLEELRAPIKGFYTFDESAHSPMFEEPEKMKQIMQQDILTGANRLADDM